MARTAEVIMAEIVSYEIMADMKLCEESDSLTSKDYMATVNRKLKSLYLELEEVCS